MQSSKKIVHSEVNEKFLDQQAIDYINAGVGCNCLVVLFETGLLASLIKNRHVSEEDLHFYGDPVCLKSALITLEKSGVVKNLENGFEITELGKALANNIGLVTIFFDGYGKLISEQVQIIHDKIRKKNRLIRGDVVSKSATLISRGKIDLVISREVSLLKLAGTICDLGCGCATMLSKICNATGNPGLGFDSEVSVVRDARKRFKNINLTVEVADITRLQGIWEDVVILMQFHVFHDFTPNEKCLEIMNSYLSNFPNLKCFFYMDTVTPSPLKNQILPGFDYVHGLLGIQTRTYEETLEMFSQSAYRMVKEVPLSLPNTFLWLLVPKKRA